MWRQGRNKPSHNEEETKNLIRLSRIRKELLEITKKKQDKAEAENITVFTKRGVTFIRRTCQPSEDEDGKGDQAFREQRRVEAPESGIGEPCRCPPLVRTNRGAHALLIKFTTLAVAYCDETWQLCITETRRGRDTPFEELKCYSPTLAHGLATADCSVKREVYPDTL